MTKTSTWLSRHVGGTIVASILGLSMIMECGCKSNNNDAKRKEGTRITFTTPEVTTNSVSGTVGIEANIEGNNQERHYPVANIVVRAFQWHPKQGAPNLTNEDKEIIDNVIFNAKFGSWKLAAETTTDNKGHYVFKGNIPSRYETFIEVVGISRPAEGLPTTYIIANKDVEAYNYNKIRNGYEIKNSHYGSWEIEDSCPEGINCILGRDNNYWYHTPGKLTKDDRILYAFRRSLDAKTNMQDGDVIPRAPRHLANFRMHDGKNNPIIDFILKSDEVATIIPERWYELATTYTPIHSDDKLKVGTSILDIIKFMTDTMLPGCDNKNSTIIDLHYYPEVTTFCQKTRLNEYQSSKESVTSTMPDILELEKYASNHYHIDLPPNMHLKSCFGQCYPQRLKELLLNSGLFRKGAKQDFRDLEKELDKADPYRDIRDNNCR